MVRNFEEFINQKKQQYGDKFSTNDINSSFIPHFNSQQKIKVEQNGQIATGRISVTTGWRPSFILMRRKNSVSSSFVINDNCKLIAFMR